MDNGGEEEIEGTCNKREQRKQEARASGADKEKTGGRGEERKRQQRCDCRKQEMEVGSEYIKGGEGRHKVRGSKYSL